jgi:hypothetical protein
MGTFQRSRLLIRRRAPGQSRCLSEAASGQPVSLAAPTLDPLRNVAIDYSGSS